jgi:hypothetical protein
MPGNIKKRHALSGTWGDTFSYLGAFWGTWGAL